MLGRCVQLGHVATPSIYVHVWLMREAPSCRFLMALRAAVNKVDRCEEVMAAKKTNGG